VPTDKLELIRRALPEFQATQRATDDFAEDLVWDFSEFNGWVEDGLYLGTEGFNEQMQRWTAPFTDWTMEYTELVDLGANDVLALGVQRGHLTDSGAVVEMPLAQILTVENDKLKRIRIFATHDDARAAAGVSG